MSNWSAGVVAIANAVVGIAILAVLVSKNAQTPQVINAAGSAFSNAIRAATGPVSGSQYGSGITSPVGSYFG